ncbi:MAG TPA: ADP-ribosylglycohydrolase family protein [Fusibacter sp.]|nr:ADP-ribosylglycohydrolase family protein [Fusibacter sp.]
MERLKGMLFGAFVGDAYALGLHWVYDTDKVKQEIDKLEGYISPSKDSFHSGKRKGDFTHYGDQSLLLLKSIASNQGFALDVFKTHWLTYMNKYEGYMDRASKESLQLLDSMSNQGSSSDELGGLVRIAPLVFYHFDDPALVKYIEKQTMLTHNNDALITYGRFIADLLLELIIGKPLLESIHSVSQNYPAIQSTIQKLEARLEDDTTEVIKDIGQSCSSQFAFPASMYLIIKYATRFDVAMKQNVLGGGDSAGRGMLIGMILGATLGYSNIPPSWIKSLNAYNLINGFTQHKMI